MALRETLKASSPKPTWTIRSVNGKTFPILPKSVIHELYVVDRDSYEDTNGNLQRTILGEKDKFLLTFPAMDQYTMDEILSIVPTGKLIVVYEDYYNPSKTRTAAFYRGDTKKEPYMRNTGKRLQQDGRYTYDMGFSFNLIAYNTRKI